MRFIESLRDLFASETFVRVTKGGEYILGTHRRLFGRIYRWIRSGEYIYLSTLYKAHREVGFLLIKIGESAAAEKSKEVSKLRALGVALRGFSQVENKQLDELVQRINIAIAKAEPPAEALQPSPASFAHDCTELLLRRSLPRPRVLTALLSPCNEDERKEIGRLVVEQFFDPILVDSCNAIAQKGLQEAVYYETLLRIRAPYEIIATCFGTKDLSNALERRGFALYLKDNFLIPLLKRKLAKCEGRMGEIIDTVNDLQKYVHDMEIVSSECLKRDEALRAVQTECSRILASLFSERHSFSTTRPSSSQESLAVLSQSYIGEDKNAINGWLISLGDAQSVVTELTKQLSQGVYVGKDFVVDSSLKTSLLVPARDRNILLCWQFYLKVATYCSECRIDDPERRASELLVLFAQDSTSQVFFSNLSKLAERPLVPSTVTLRDVGKREGISFLCSDSRPVVQVNRVFQEAEHPDNPGFFVGVTMSRMGRNVVTEVETTPCVFSGAGLHIERSQGEYRLREDSLLSKLRSRAGSVELYPFSADGMRALIAQIDSDLSQGATATTTSLRYLERKLCEEVPTNNFYCAVDSPGEMLMKKICSVKKENASMCDTAFGKNLARCVIDQARGKDLALTEFLTLLDTWIIEIWRKENPPHDVMDGFFSELREEFPLHKEALQKKEREHSLFLKDYPPIATKSFVSDVTSEEGLNAFDQRPGRSDSRGDMAYNNPYYQGYNKLVSLLAWCQRLYSDRFPSLLENIYIEKGIPLLFSFIKKRLLSKELDKEAVTALTYYFMEMQMVVPFPKRPFFDPLHVLLKKESFYPDFEQKLFLFVGGQIGEKVVTKNPDYLNGAFLERDFSEKQEWLSKAFSRENAQQIIEGMRLTCGFRYGFALAKQMERISLQQFFFLLERERALAPLRFSQVMRGALHELDQRPRAAEELRSFCSDYVKWLLRKLGQVPLDEWMNNHFRIFLSIPLSASMETIFGEVIKKICESYPKEKAEAFFDRISFYITKEAHVATHAVDCSVKILAHLDFFGSLPIPEEFHKRVRSNLGVSLVST